MSLGTILIIIVIIYLLGGFSGRFGGYGYGMGHSGMGGFIIGLFRSRISVKQAYIKGCPEMTCTVYRRRQVRPCDPFAISQSRSH